MRATGLIVAALAFAAPARGAMVTYSVDGFYVDARMGTTPQPFSLRASAMASPAT